MFARSKAAETHKCVKRLYFCLILLSTHCGNSSFSPAEPQLRLAVSHGFASFLKMWESLLPERGLFERPKVFRQLESHTSICVRGC